MNQFLFKNRWFALAFVGAILLGVYVLVGEGRSGSLLGNVQGSVAGQRDEAEAQLAQIGTVNADAPPPAIEPDQAVSDDEFYGDDGDLIDSADGTDPNPEEEEAGPAPGQFIGPGQVLDDSGEVVDAPDDGQ